MILNKSQLASGSASSSIPEFRAASASVLQKFWRKSQTKLQRDSTMKSMSFIWIPSEK